MSASSFHNRETNIMKYVWNLICVKFVVDLKEIKVVRVMLSDT